MKMPFRNELDHRACGFIRQWINDTTLYHAEEENDNQCMEEVGWNICNQDVGQQSSTPTKLSNLKCVDWTSIPTHLNEFQNVLIQLKQLKINYDNKV